MTEGTDQSLNFTVLSSYSPFQNEFLFGKKDCTINHSKPRAATDM